MNYNELINYLDGLTNLGVNPSLQAMRLFGRLLGEPYRKYPCLQITGTNGKTSTAAFTAAVLTAHGLKCGLYTSPHLLKYNERLAIDNCAVNDQELAALGSRLMPIIKAVNQRLQPRALTKFEVLTGLAYTYFAEAGVDAAVIEVGMGGRWDATSVVTPKTAVFTKIAQDHTNYLGADIAAVAGEKSYLIKAGTKAVSAVQTAAARAVLQTRARSQSGEVAFMGRDFFLEPPTPPSVFNIRGRYGFYEDLRLRVGGTFQRLNATLAVAAAETFLGRSLSGPKLAKALLEVNIIGRFALVEEAPTVIIDGAHNYSGVKQLMRGIQKRRYRRLLLVLSILRDKDTAKMLAVLLAPAALAIATTNKNPRALSPAELASMCRAAAQKNEYKCRIKTASNPAAGLAAAKAEADVDDLILVAGSLYGAGEALKSFTAYRD